MSGAGTNVGDQWLLMTKEAEVFEAVLLVIRRRPPCMKIVSVLVDPDLSEELDGQRRPAQLGRDLAAPLCRALGFARDRTRCAADTVGRRSARQQAARTSTSASARARLAKAVSTLPARQLPQRADTYVTARRGFRDPSYTTQ